MAAFFALLAGLTIGVFVGMFLVGVMIGHSETFRRLIIDLCVAAREEDI